MNSIKTHYFIPFAIVLFLSCNRHDENSYAIRDFTSSLRPHLTKIVSNGVFGYFDTSLRHLATDDDLNKISRSEHPILRAFALREMLSRKTFNHYDVLINHLNDTATIATDAGEWGTYNRTVTDYILLEIRSLDSIEKGKIIDTLITGHNNLKSTYEILCYIAPQEKYYSYIKQMTQRTRRFEEIECALFALAKFKKTEDILLIKNSLSFSCWQLKEISFQLMKDFPNEIYLDIYEKYYPKYFYRSLFNYDGNSPVEAFINSLATYKNTRSAHLLGSILNKNISILSAAANKGIKGDVIRAINNNQCTAYLKLTKQIAKRM